MTVGPPGGRPATAHRESRRRAVLLAPLSALAFAGVAITGAYLTSGRSTPRPSGSAKLAAPSSRASSAPPLRGAFPFEPGPEGTTGQWIGDAASINLVGLKQSWVAFRALSLRGDRTLSLTTLAGASAAAHIGTRPDMFVVGPFPEGNVSLRPTPASRVASQRDSRRVSVFVSTVRTFGTPVAALPGAGFWGVERAPGLAFNWLRDTGVIDILAPEARARVAWLTFVGRSLGEERALIASSGQTVSRVRVSTSAHLVTLGPFSLVHGRARVLLRASPGPRRYGDVDRRQLSVQVALLAAHASASEL
jgi:hypothetical protein